MSRLVSLPPPTAFLFDSLRSERFVQIHTVQFFDSSTPSQSHAYPEISFVHLQGVHLQEHDKALTTHRTLLTVVVVVVVIEIVGNSRTRCTFEPESDILLALTVVCFAYHCSDPTYPSAIHPLPTLPYLTLVRIVIR